MTKSCSCQETNRTSEQLNKLPNMSQNHLKQVFLWTAANVVSLQWGHAQPLCDYNKHQLQNNEQETVMAATVTKVMRSIKKSTQRFHVSYGNLWRTAFLLVICPEVKERLWNAAVNGFYYSMWCLAKNLTDLKPGIQVLAHSNLKTTKQIDYEKKKKHNLLNSLKTKCLSFIKPHSLIEFKITLHILHVYKIHCMYCRLHMCSPVLRHITYST